jgi:hypothetical protein
MTPQSPTHPDDTDHQSLRTEAEATQASHADRRSARITEVVYAVFVLAAGVLLVVSAV